MSGVVSQWAVEPVPDAKGGQSWRLRVEPLTLGTEMMWLIEPRDDIAARVLDVVIGRTLRAMAGELHDDSIFAESDNFTAWFGVDHVYVEDPYNEGPGTPHRAALLAADHFVEFVRWLQHGFWATRDEPAAIAGFELTLVAEGEPAREQFAALRAAAGLNQELFWDDSRDQT